ncbi:hypothetical protein M885DRAFT_530151 [Pelagophyceae sp. CCMP2097]|nr:hypothetical protein M885DRAFT_530151 [Pelagophyceae sp. CCMP2097]
MEAAAGAEWRDVLRGRGAAAEAVLARAAELRGAALARAVDLKRAAGLSADPLLPTTRGAPPLPPSAAFDVRIAGSGFLSLYFLGAYTILDGACELARFAGASSGAQMPMELILLGTSRALDVYYANALLQEAAPCRTLAGGAWRADAHWKDLADHLFEAGGAASKLSGRCFAAVTRLTLRGPRGKLYGEYPSDDVARSVFYATGTLLTKVEGYYCTDGGVVDACPDLPPTEAAEGHLGQLICRPTKLAGVSLSRAVRFTAAEATEVVNQGQDDICELIRQAAASKWSEPVTVAGGALAFVPARRRP